jgi:hypothetical protein
MAHTHEPPLTYLWHPGTRDHFSGYGLTIAPYRLVGLVMVDRPHPVDPNWLAEIERVFGGYQLVPMIRGGEHGILCQMHVAPESRSYLRTITHPMVAEIREALSPLLVDPPAVTLAVAWDQTSGCWLSTIMNPPRFPLGQLLITRGADKALKDAVQDPREFLARHQSGDWGEVPEADKTENEVSLQRGFRLLSAYRTTHNVKIWVITEADRSATTLLLPEEY